VSADASSAKPRTSWASASCMSYQVFSGPVTRRVEPVASVERGFFGSRANSSERTCAVAPNATSGCVSDAERSPGSREARTHSHPGLRPASSKVSGPAHRRAHSAAHLRPRFRQTCRAGWVSGRAVRADREALSEPDSLRALACAGGREPLALASPRRSEAASNKARAPATTRC
jgi:hypothetical protein